MHSFVHLFVLHCFSLWSSKLHTMKTGSICHSHQCIPSTQHWAGMEQILHPYLYRVGARSLQPFLPALLAAPCEVLTTGVPKEKLQGGRGAWIFALPVCFFWWSCTSAKHLPPGCSSAFSSAAAESHVRDFHYLQNQPQRNQHLLPEVRATDWQGPVSELRDIIVSAQQPPQRCAPLP